MLSQRLSGTRYQFLRVLYTYVRATKRSNLSVMSTEAQGRNWYIKSCASASSHLIIGKESSYLSSLPTTWIFTKSITVKLKEGNCFTSIMAFMMFSIIVIALLTLQTRSQFADAASATEEKCDPKSHDTDTTADDQATSLYSTPAPYKAFETSQHKSSSSSNNNNHGGHFGHILDAGTGSESLRWLASLLDKSMIDSFTAITADEMMLRRVTAQANELGISNKGQVIVGNWIDGVNKNTGKVNSSSRRKKKNGSNILLHQGEEAEQFDTILVDYLIGAMDKFSPYFQDVIFERLNTHLRPGGRLLILGMEPISDESDGKSSGVAKITTDIKHARDACQLLAGERPYREFPLSWIERTLAKVDGLTIVQRKIFPYKYNFQKLSEQIALGRRRVNKFSSGELKAVMTGVLDELEARSLKITKGLKDGTFTSGFNYVVIVEKDM